MEELNVLLVAPSRRQPKPENSGCPSKEAKAAPQPELKRGPPGMLAGMLVFH